MKTAMKEREPMEARIKRPVVAMAIAFMLSALLSQGVAQGATLFVTNLNDSGPGSLRQAIADADPGDTVEIVVSGTVMLSGGELGIDKDLNIVGPGADQVIISGGGNDRVFYILGSSVAISGVTVREGSHSEGGGIRNDGMLTLTHSIVTRNTARSAAGGIANFGTLDLSHSTVSYNSVANGSGGGITNDSGCFLRLIHSTVSNNTAYVGSGGIMNFGSLTLTNSTVSGNTANNNSGGIYTSDTLNLIHSTISDNSSPFGGGVWVSGGLAESAYSIIADNPSGGDCAGSGISSHGYNLDSDGTCGFTNPDDLPNTNPHLGPLADNGGETFTHALLTGSPAIDHIHLEECVLSTDQRDVARPQGDKCDVGAYEAILFDTFDMDVSYAEGYLSLDFTIGTEEPATWSTYLVLTYPDMAVFPIWSISLPEIPRLFDVPVSFPLPSMGWIGVYTTLTMESGEQEYELEWVDTGW